MPLSPTLIKIILAAVLMFGMGGKMWWDGVQVDRLTDKLALAETNIIVLETSLQAEHRKAAQRELDSLVKQDTITTLAEEKAALAESYINTKTELEHILNDIIPNITTPAELITAQETVQAAVSLSYGCIESATRGVPCD